jgi:Luciferase-like monooxygenase/Amidohydrolase
VGARDHGRDDGSAGIATAILSVSSPDVYLGNDDAARDLARSVNEYAARTVQDHRGRLGTFASLPLPNIDATLEEIRYALEVLKVNGFVMLTNCRGIYLGDAKFDPIFDELNRRSAIIFNSPDVAIVLGAYSARLSAPYDRISVRHHSRGHQSCHQRNARTMSKPHAGGTLPFLARRIEGMVSRLSLARERGPSGGFPHSIAAAFLRYGGVVGDNSTASLLTLNLFTYVAISPDRRQALADAGGTVAFYASISQYEKYFAAHDFGEAARRAASAAEQHDYAAMRNAIPDDMVETFAIVGTPEQVRTKLAALWEMADSVTLIPPTNFLTLDQIIAYQQAIATTVYQ